MPAFRGMAESTY